MKVVILVGGFGTRLREVVSDVPKPMALIAGKPFLEHQINFLKEFGLKDIILCVYYKADVIKSYFGDGRHFGVNLTYSEEDVPLGTAGAIKKAEKYIDGTFFVLNGDSYLDADLMKFLEFHKSMCFGGASMVLTEAKDSSNYGSVLVENNKVVSFLEKGRIGVSKINAGVYLFEPSILDLIPPGKKVSLEGIFPKLAEEGKLFGFLHNGYFIDIGRPETYHQFRQNFLNRLLIGNDDSVRTAMKLLDKNNTDILLVVDEDKKLLGILNNKIIRNFLIGGGRVEQGVSFAMIRDPEKVGRTNQNDSEIVSILKQGTHHLPILDEEGRVFDIRFYKEELRQKIFPVVRGKSPLRISFAGGGTDLPYFFERHGGAVINITIDKYCYATANKRADSKIVIDSNLFEGEIVLDSNNLEYNGKYDIVKAAFKILRPGFGVDFHFHNDIVPERGLGSSASFAVLVVKILGKLQGIEYNDETIAELAYKIEIEELGIKGGKQDQYAAIFGGLNWIEFIEGDRKIMHPLRLKEYTLNELRSHLTLYYTGKGHCSSEQHSAQSVSFVQNEGENIRRLNRLKEIAVEIKENLLSVRPDFERIGKLLHESWESKRKLSSCVSNEKINDLYNLGIENGAYGGKLLGSGGGGYILFIHPPKKKNTLVRALKNEFGEVLDFNFDFDGVKTWFAEK